MQRLLVRRSSGASPWEEPNNMKMMSVITSECKCFFLSTMIATGIIVAAVTVPVLFLVLFIVFNAWCYCHIIPHLECQAEEEDGVVHLSRLRHSLGNHLPNGEMPQFRHGSTSDLDLGEVDLATLDRDCDLFVKPSAFSGKDDTLKCFKKSKLFPIQFLGRGACCPDMSLRLASYVVGEGS
ncbi:hypothetical protein DFH11DRAFT_1551845 [Phellopilus nigrolimitatus]|nr:hypothetical protein DFH11DRAFT_1551845 [Phellopilus nigrolimitatus]